jgi:hypothetical protein
VAFLLVLAGVLYVSLRPVPDVRTLPLGPHWLLNWLEKHDFIKNMLGFGALAFAGMAALEGRPAFDLTVAVGPLRAVVIKLGKFLLLLCCFVLGLEIVQALLPWRCSDWKDVLAGTVAGLLAWVLFHALAMLKSAEGRRRFTGIGFARLTGAPRDSSAAG